MSQRRARSIRSTARWACMLGVGILAPCLVALPNGVRAQSWENPSDRYENDRYDYAAPDSGGDYGDPVGWGARLGVGFTTGLKSFLVDVAAPYSTGGGVSIGPRLQLGLANDSNYVAPTLHIEYAHDFRAQVQGPLARIRPLVHAGLGFAWLEEDGRPGDDSEVGFLFDIGGGVEFPLTEQFGIASVMDFNILPKKTLDETLIFTWQIVQLRMNF